MQRARNSNAELSPMSLHLILGAHNASVVLPSARIRFASESALTWIQCCTREDDLNNQIDDHGGSIDQGPSKVDKRRSCCMGNSQRFVLV